ncbi:MAG: hypothetical protein IJ390_00730 [Lachnospiraceae bacterium]|nr:hypothetical protein [Lachnospiraceae bacterium]
MSESYVECLVARKQSGGWNALKVFLTVLMVICIIGGMVFYPILLLALAAGVGAYFVAQRANVEYEYLYVDKEVTVDKIMNKTKRKKAESFDLDSVEIFAPIKSWHLDGKQNGNYKVTDYSSGVEEKPDKRYVMIYKGGRKIIFEPSVAMVKAMQNVAPRKVFLD